MITIGELFTVKDDGCPISNEISLNRISTAWRAA